MKLLYIILTTVLTSSLFYSQSISRYEISPAGRTYIASNGIFSYTIGGLIVSSKTSSSLQINQGFEQGYPPLNPANIVFPNAFSPNGDGVNDYWLIRFEEEISDLEITIINRYGDRMCHVQNYHSGDNIWNGKLNNDGPWSVNGTYFYLIESKSKQIRLNGWLQIVR